MKPMQGIQWVNCAFSMFVLKTDLYSFMGFCFSLYTYSMCLNTGQGTLFIYLIEHFLF